MEYVRKPSGLLVPAEPRIHRPQLCDFFGGNMMMGPAGPELVEIYAWGAGAGNNEGGAGAGIKLSAPYSVVSGRTITLNVGGRGAGANVFGGYISGGGGCTTVYANWLAAYLAYAAGGGGGVYNGTAWNGGAGGDTTGGQNAQNRYAGGAGATPSSGGAYGGGQGYGGTAWNGGGYEFVSGGYNGGGGAYSGNSGGRMNAGGGGGYYGGGAGDTGSGGHGGGGGCSWLNTSAGFTATAYAGNYQTPGNSGGVGRGQAGQTDRDGRVVIVIDNVIVATFDCIGATQTYTFSS